MSSRDINLLVPELKTLCALHIDACAKVNLRIIITCTARFYKEQVALFAQGRQILEDVNALRKLANMQAITGLENEHKVTWTLNSKHLINLDDSDQFNDFSRAYDIAVVAYSGKAMYDVKVSVNNNEIPDYREVGEIGEKLGLKWGGKFRDKHGNLRPDYPHFELCK